MRLLFALVVVLLGMPVFAADQTPPPPYDESISKAEALDVSEAVFRYQFEHNSSATRQKAESYYLSLFGKDPDAKFLARFKDHKPPVKKGSEFKVNWKSVKFRVDRIKRIDKTSVKVKGGYYEGSTSASGNIYILKNEKGKWKVTKATRDWIS